MVSSRKIVKQVICVISGFRRKVSENCPVLGYYAASGGNFLPTFRDNLSVPSSRVKLKIGPIGCQETSVRNYHHSLRNNNNNKNNKNNNNNYYYYYYYYYYLLKLGCYPVAVVILHVNKT